MASNFSAAEIVELGVQIEKNGEAFYLAMAEKAEDKKAAELFTFLAGEERHHIAAFERLHDAVEEYAPHESYPDEYFAYMREIASEHIFIQEPDGAKLAGTMKDEKEALAMALRFENDSIRFYEEMKKLVTSGDLKVVDALIEQEKQHAAKIMSLQSDLEC